MMRVRVLVVLLSVGILLAVWATGITYTRLGEGSFYVKNHWTGRAYVATDDDGFPPTVLIRAPVVRGAKK